MTSNNMTGNNETFEPFHSPQKQQPLNSNWAAKRKLADATRRLIENLVTCTTNTQELEIISDQVNKQANELQKAPQLFGASAYEQESVGVEDDVDGMHIGYELNAVDGKSNPVAPPLTIWIDGEEAFAEVKMGWQYEGPPKAIHGGFIAAVFDQFLGVAQKITGQPGFTGTMTIRYLKPTPLDVPLQLKGRVERVEGRKNFLVGEMWAGDQMTATCECVFISVTPEKMRGWNDENT